MDYDTDVKHVWIELVVLCLISSCYYMALSSKIDKLESEITLLNTKGEYNQ